MPKARTLVDDFGYIAEDGTRLSHPAGTVVELDEARYDELVEAGSVEPAAAKGRGKKAEGSADEAGSVEPAADDAGE